MVKMPGKRFYLFLLMPMVCSASELGYPENWSPPLDRENNVCASLAGNYKYFGEASEGSVVKNPMLEVILFSRVSIFRNRETSWVEVQHDISGGRLVVAIHSPQDVVSYSQRASCEQGWTKLVYDLEGYADGTQTKSHEEIFVSRATDGTLIARYNFDSESRHLFIFKSRRQGSAWYRFFPMQ